METDFFDLALRRLSVREYGSGEMKAYLIRKGAVASEATRIVEELTREKRLDDERYARVIARHQAFRDRGPAFIQAALRQKGVNLPLAEVKKIYSETLPICDAPQSEEEMVRRVLEKRYPRASDSAREKGKAFQALLRRGFSADVIRRCFTEKNKCE